MILATKAAVAHGGAGVLPYLWVIAGDNSGGKLATSDDDGANWTVQTTPFGANIIRSVASNGSDLWVAGGENGVLATSPDAVTWTAQTSSFGSSDILEVIWANGLWVACGQGGKIATSTNGTTWTQQTSGSTALLQGADYGSGTYGVGGQNDFLTSTDGSTWTSRTTSTNIKRHGVHYFAAASVWVVGADTGTTNALASSADAASWTQRTSALNNSGVWSAFASKDTILVNNLGTGGLGLTFQTQSSTNGTTYTSRGTTNNTDVACSDTGVFLASKISGTQVGKSTNGTSWSDVTTSGLGSIVPYCIAHSSMKPGSRA